MRTSIQQQLSALGLAVFVTVGVLGGLNGLASHEAARAAEAATLATLATQLANSSVAPQAQRKS